MSIDKKEVLRYLGYKGQVIDDKMNNLIDECMREIIKISKPRYTYEIFYMNSDFKLFNTNYSLLDNDIKNHLKNCEKCVILAATLGITVDNKIKYYEKINMTKAYIIDACATAYIESICDKVETEIKEIATKENKYITSRYSPGYGDFKIENQGKIIDLIDGNQKIGVLVTESSILIPRKSVTAFIGIVSHRPQVIYKCSICSKNKDCTFKRGGHNCEY